MNRGKNIAVVSLLTLFGALAGNKLGPDYELDKTSQNTNDVQNITNIANTVGGGLIGGTGALLLLGFSKKEEEITQTSSQAPADPQL